MLIDTHCHVNMIVKKEFDELLSEDEIKQAKMILDEAILHDVSLIVNVGTSLIESKNIIILANKYREFYAVIGIHPTDALRASLDDIRVMKQWLYGENSEKIIGIGECGFDFYREGLPLEKQEDFFVAQIELALEFNRAVVVHSRDAYDETLKVLERYKKNNLRAVIHCFSYDQQFANTINEWGLYIGIGGTITYPKNDQLREVIRTLPLSSFVLETDAPFLPIQAMRGKTNHPQYIRKIAEYIAQLKQITIDEVSAATTKNSLDLFCIKI